MEVEESFGTVVEGTEIKLGDLQVAPCSIKEIKPILETGHYLHSIKGLTHELCFKVHLDGYIVGASVFGKPAYVGVSDKYSGGGRLLELRRFFMADGLPRNN